MAKRIKGITIEIGGETKGLEKALSSVTKESIGVGKELQDVQRLLKLNPGNAELVAQKQQLLAKQVEITSTKLKGLRDAQEQVDQQFKNGEISEEQYRAFNREIEATEGALKGYKGQLANVQSEQDRLSKNTSRLDTLFQATGTSVEDFQDILGSKLTNSIKNGSASADDMEVALNKIGRASLGNDADIGKLKDTLDSIDDGNAIDNVRLEIDRMGSSSDEATEKVSKLTEIVGSELLMDAADKASEASEKLLELGKSGVESAAEMRASNAQFEQVFGDLESKARGVSDRLGNEFGMLPQRINPGLAKMTSMFMGLGYSTEDALSMAENAVRSSADAAAFYDQSFEDANGSITSFLKGNYEAGESIGLFANDTQMAAYAIKNDLIPSTKGAKEATEAQLVALEKAQKGYDTATKKYGEGSVEAREKMLSLKKAQDAITESTSDQAGKWQDLDEATKQAVRMDYITSMQKMSGSTGQAAREMDGYENVMGNVSSLTDQFMAAIGDEALDMFIGAIQSLLPAIQSLVDWISGLNPTIKQFATLLGVALIAVGAILPVVAALGAAASVAGVSIGALVTTTLLPIIGIIAAITAGITALILVFQNWSTIVQWVTDLFAKFGIDIGAVWETIRATVTSVVETVSAFVQQIWGTLVAWWNQNNQLIYAAAQNVWNAISSVITTVMNIIKPYITATWNNIKTVITTVWNVIKSVVTTAINVVLSVITAVMNVLTGNWSGAWNAMKGAVSSILNGIKSTVSNIIQGVASVITNTLSGIGGTVSNIFNGIKSAIEGPMNAAKDIVRAAIDAIKGFFNFKFEWPKISLPHFSISGSLNPIDWIKDGGLPKISVDWFAKGGILTKPTVFGQNGGSLMVGGEAGKEAVAPIDTLMGYVRQAVAEVTDNNRQPLVVNQYITSPQPLTPREMEREAYFYLRNLAK